MWRMKPDQKNAESVAVRRDKEFRVKAIKNMAK